MNWYMDVKGVWRLFWDFAYDIVFCICSAGIQGVWQITPEKTKQIQSELGTWISWGL